MTTRFAQVVIGPAGSGKSTYIKHAVEYYKSIKRVVHCVNLDPAADDLQYEPVIDVRTAINVKEIMDTLGYGPNGALVHCMEELVSDMTWFDDQIGEHEYDYLLIDLPGQIELFSHLPILPSLLAILKEKGYYLCAVFLLDSQFMIDPSKFLSGGLVALSAMTMLEIPHINVLSKCDLLSIEQRELIDSYTEFDTDVLSSLVAKQPKIEKLTEKICELINSFNLLQFQMLDLKDNESLANLETQIDMLLQYFDNADMDDPEFEDPIVKKEDDE